MESVTSFNVEQYAEPLVTIRGAPDMYVKHGSPVTLHCHIDSFLKIPNQVDWYLNRTLLSQLKIAPKHGISFLLAAFLFCVTLMSIGKRMEQFYNEVSNKSDASYSYRPAKYKGLI